MWDDETQIFDFTLKKETFFFSKLHTSIFESLEDLVEVCQVVWLGVEVNDQIFWAIDGKIEEEVTKNVLDYPFESIWFRFGAIGIHTHW